MRDNTLEWDEGGSFDYWPNELAQLSDTDPVKYRRIVESNLEKGDTVEAWQARNLERAKQDLAEQRLKS